MLTTYQRIMTRRDRLDHLISEVKGIRYDWAKWYGAHGTDLGTAALDASLAALEAAYDMLQDARDAS